MGTNPPPVIPKINDEDPGDNNSKKDTTERPKKCGKICGKQQRSKHRNYTTAPKCLHLLSHAVCTHMTTGTTSNSYEPQTWKRCMQTTEMTEYQHSNMLA